jgi:hypothetical protein
MKFDSPMTSDCLFQNLHNFAFVFIHEHVQIAASLLRCDPVSFKNLSDGRSKCRMTTFSVTGVANGGLLRKQTI